jgi:isoaspartyl peptidase/L-asparaginase-like protein (Ntn-hydrolase superfamily)
VKQENTFNTSAYDYYPSIAVDGSGNVYVAHNTDGTVSGVTNIGGNTRDIVVFKMDSSGNLKWVKQQNTFNTSDDDYNPSIAVDGSGKVYVAYNTRGTVSGGTNIGGYDIVVFKLGNIQGGWYLINKVQA